MKHRFKLMPITVCTILFCLPVLAGEASEWQRGADHSSVRKESALTDIVLGAGGTLQGQLLDEAGEPTVGKTVRLLSGGVEVACATTDQFGQFRILAVRGGTHQLMSGDHSRFLRTWTQDVAPPGAKPQVVFSTAPVVRGQFGGTIGPSMPSIHPWRYLNHPATLGGIIAAGLIVPTAMHKPTPDAPFQVRDAS